MSLPALEILEVLQCGEGFDPRLLAGHPTLARLSIQPLPRARTPKTIAERMKTWVKTWAGTPPVSTPWDLDDRWLGLSETQPA